MAINVSVPYNSGLLPAIVLFIKNLNASKPSEHAPPGEKLSKCLVGNIGCRDKEFLVSKGFPNNVTTSGQQYNIREKPSVIPVLVFRFSVPVRCFCF